MDANKVLSDYINFCNNDSGLYEYNFASNGILECFGKTFRGSNRMHHNLRYNISQQYEHIFSSGSACDPFECRQTHLETQNEPAENFFTPAEPSTIIAYDTPPQQLLSKLSPKLPPVTQGRTFLPQLDDTIDDSSNDDSLPCITPAKQKSLPSHKPPICRPVDACDEQDVSPNDVKPLPNVSGDDDVPVTIALHSTKKRSRSVDTAPTPKRCRMHDESPAASSAGCSNVNPCDTSIMISTVDANPTTYSELKYLEAVGIMRTIKQPKHRGISATAGGIGAAASIHSSHDPHNDRMTKIKMSYRIRKTDGDVQFALIVYEQVTRNPVTRRNLMAEFNETSMPTPKSNKSVKKRKKPIVIEREPSLRRLRF